MLNRFLYLLYSANKTLKNTGKWKEILENCQSENVGTMVLHLIYSTKQLLSPSKFSFNKFVFLYHYRKDYGTGNDSGDSNGKI